MHLFCGVYRRITGITIRYTRFRCHIFSANFLIHLHERRGVPSRVLLALGFAEITRRLVLLIVLDKRRRLPLPPQSP